jgi:transglutaminase-like putative cysteine protease
MVSPAELSARIMSKPEGTVGGDCDDSAMLLAALNRSMGIPSSVAFLDTDGDHQIDHAITVLQLEGKAVYAETTLRGVQLGWAPPKGQVQTLLM